MLTAGSGALRLSGVGEDINTSGHHDAVRSRDLALYRATGGGWARPESTVTSLNPSLAP